MVESSSIVKTAIVQAAPVLFNREATLEKAVQWIKKASAPEVRIILFPEAYIPAYPRGMSFGAVIGSRTPGGRKAFQLYWENAVEIPGPTTEALGKAAREHQVYLAMGLIERDKQFSGGTLYCTMLYFGPDGRILGKHRKLKPTASERLVWGEGDGSTLTVLATPFGKIGGLICWENYMPLARMALYGKGIDIYLAPTADARDTWQATLRHIACEGRCFVLGCNQFVTKAMYPPEIANSVEFAAMPDIVCRGGSTVISPMGNVLAGPLYDQEGILYAELDLTDISKSRFDFDVTGHYARPDVFQLIVNENPALPVSFSGKKV